MAFAAISSRRQAATGSDAVTSLVQRMRERTAQLHCDAEGSGIIAALLAGRVSRRHYALYLRNLLPAYQAMEHALRHHRGRPVLAELAQPPVYRAESIVADLTHLAGPDWAAALPLLPAGERYGGRVEWAGAGAMLIAHCYTRYLGDLNGGPIIGRRLARSFGGDASALAFTVFPAIADVRGFAAAYRARLDRAGAALPDIAPVVEEAVIAFQLNIEVSQEVERFLTA